MTSAAITTNVVFFIYILLECFLTTLRLEELTALVADIAQSIHVASYNLATHLFFPLADSITIRIVTGHSRFEYTSFQPCAAISDEKVNPVAEKPLFSRKLYVLQS
jgi:hypothetical protein